jgi:alkylation response protein AidB-like acyl-CoA dehydrogenase
MLAELRPRGVADDPAVRQLAAQVWIDAKVLELLGARVAADEGGPSGAEGAVVRLASIRLSRRTDELLDAMRGAGAMLVDDWTLHQLWIPATRIGGGTEEALRTVVARRVLGLPKAPTPSPTGDTFRPQTAVTVTGSPDPGDGGA